MASKKAKPAAELRRYAAFLRGVSPMNATMPDLKRCFEAAGFSDVTTVLASGNVVFSAPESSVEELERRAERSSWSSSRRPSAPTSPRARGTR